VPIKITNVNYSFKWFALIQTHSSTRISRSFSHQ